MGILTNLLRENRDARDIFTIGCIGLLCWVMDEVLGALGKGQFKTPLNVTAVMICLLIALNRITPVFDAVAQALGITP